MSLKDFIRAATPPLFWTAVRSLKANYRTYPTWESAVRAAGSYDDRMVNEFRAARVGRPNPRLLDGNAIRWLVELLPAPLDIVDFGGATGEVGAAIGACGYQANYSVVENATLAALMADRGAATFTSAIPSSCDVFFTSGTVQYIPDPYGALEQGFAAARRAVVLKRNNFSEREIFRVHHSRLF